jgi:hypothetical protein
MIGWIDAVHAERT